MEKPLSSASIRVLSKFEIAPSRRASPQSHFAMRFISALGACGMHEAVGAGRQRRRSWVKSPSLNAATQALGRRKRRSAAPAGPSVAIFAVLRAPGCAQAGALVLAGRPPAYPSKLSGHGSPGAGRSDLKRGGSTDHCATHTHTHVKRQVCGQELQPELLCASQERTGQNSCQCCYYVNACAS